MNCPQCGSNLDLECDFEDEEVGWESYGCSRCSIEVIKYEVRDSL